MLVFPLNSDCFPHKEFPFVQSPDFSHQYSCFLSQNYFIFLTKSHNNLYKAFFIIDIPESHRTPPFLHIIQIDIFSTQNSNFANKTKYLFFSTEFFFPQNDWMININFPTKYDPPSQNSLFFYTEFPLLPMEFPFPHRISLLPLFLLRIPTFSLRYPIFYVRIYAFSTKIFGILVFTQISL